MTHVVGAPLEQRRGHGNGQSGAHRRQIATVELVLQRLGAGRHDDLARRQKRGNEIREGLARAGPRFDREHAAGCQRLADPVGHELLLAARLESLDDARERAVRAEQPAVFAAPVHGPRARAM